STVADLGQVIDQAYPDDAAGATAVKVQYAAASDADANDAYIRMLTDVAMRCPARTLARTLSNKGSKVYLYSYEQGKAWHSLELTYVFDMTTGCSSHRDARRRGWRGGFGVMSTTLAST